MERVLNVATFVDNNISRKAYFAAVLQSETGKHLEYFATRQLDDRLEDADYLKASLVWAVKASGTHKGEVNYSTVPAFKENPTIVGFPRCEAVWIHYKDNSAMDVLKERIGTPLEA